MAKDDAQDRRNPQDGSLQEQVAAIRQAMFGVNGFGGILRQLDKLQDRAEDDSEKLRKLNAEIHQDLSKLRVALFGAEDNSDDHGAIGDFHELRSRLRNLFWMLLSGVALAIIVAFIRGGGP